MNTERTPSQDAQRRWDESLLPVQLVAEQLESPKEKEKKKKKCHGNRKEQQKRRRSRRRQQKQQQQEQADQDDQSQAEQIQIESIDDRDHTTKQENKRKRPDSNQDDLNVSRSMSQLSISRASQPKKKQKKKDQASTTTTTTDQLMNSSEMEKTKKKKDQNFKPSYLQVSDRIFKEMLSNAIQGGQQLVQCLNTTEKLQFIRRIIELINQVHYFDLQQHLWQDYHNLGIKEGQWAPCVSISFAQQHQICRTYGYPQRVVEKRQKTIQNQLDKTIHELKLCQEELEQHSKEWEPSFDVNHLYQVMIAYVKKGQRRLREGFERRRKNLECDVQDHRLIRTLYQCEPNAEQIELAQKIWRKTSEVLKSKEREEILGQRLYLRRLPSDIDRIIIQLIGSIECLLSDSTFDGYQRANLTSTYSKTITQFKFDMMTLNWETMQTIREGHELLLLGLLMDLNRSNCNETIKQTIEARRQVMIERHDLHLQHQLKTFQ